MGDIGFVFPGQASQYVGMGEFLFRNFPEARDILEEADRALGYKISTLIRSGPMEKLTETENCQPAILTVSVAFSKILKGRGINPVVTAGHSLGEYSALVFARSISFRDALRLVRLRGKYMQEAVPLGKGAMAAVIGIDRKVVEGICKQLSRKGVVEPAGYNSPGQMVIAGEIPLVEEAMSLAKKEGAKLVKKLEVSAPFHSSLLKGAGEKLAKDLAEIEISDPWIPYVDNYRASVVTTRNKIIDSLVSQVYNPVLWEQSVEVMKKEFYITKVIEVGPGKVLTGLVKKIDKEIECISADDEETFMSLLEKGG